MGSKGSTGSTGPTAALRLVNKLGRPRLALLAVIVLLGAGAVVAVARPGADEVSSRATDGAGAERGAVGAAPAGPVPEGGPATAGGGAAADSASPTNAMSPSDAKADASAAPATLGQPGAVAEPRVVRTADVTVRVGSGTFSRAFDEVTTVATAEGGYVSGSTTSTGSRGSDPSANGSDDQPRSGELTVRVPADRFDAVRRALAGLGTVEQEQVRGEDVTAQIVDHDARLKSLQAEEDALRTLVGRATTVGEVLQVQAQLFEVRQQVESIQAQRDQLDRQASLATIRVSLMEPGAGLAPTPEPTTGLAHAVDQALDGSVAVVGGTIVVLGWLAPVALVGLMIWGVLRLRRRGAPPVAPASLS